MRQRKRRSVAGNAPRPEVDLGGRVLAQTRSGRCPTIQLEQFCEFETKLH